MPFSGKQQFKIPRPIVNKDGLNNETITGHKTLTLASSTIQRVSNSSGGNLHVILPELTNGLQFWIIAKGSDPVLVKDAAGSTIQTLVSHAVCLVHCTGSEWFVVAYIAP